MRRYDGPGMRLAQYGVLILGIIHTIVRFHRNGHGMDMVAIFGGLIGATVMTVIWFHYSW